MQDTVNFHAVHIRGCLPSLCYCYLMGSAFFLAPVCTCSLIVLFITLAQATSYWQCNSVHVSVHSHRLYSAQVMEIVLHCLDHTQLKMRGLNELFPAICRYVLQSTVLSIPCIVQPKLGRVHCPHLLSLFLWIHPGSSSWWITQCKTCWEA